MRHFWGPAICILTVLIPSVSSNAQSQVTDFRGTWTFKSGANPYRISTLVITPSVSKLEVVETRQPDKQKKQRVLTYNLEGRGESNLAIDGSRELVSRTLWKE